MGFRAGHPPMLAAPQRVTTPVTRISPETLEEAGVSKARQFSGHVEDARRELFDGLKLVDSTENRDLHVWAGDLINQLDDMREYLAQRGEGK